MELLNLFRNSKDVETFSAGETIFSAGDAGELMYVVVEGVVEVSLNGAPIETINPGGILGELSLVDRSPRSATAMAKTDCVVAPVSERRFLFLVQETPFFALHVMSVMAQRLRQRTQEVASAKRTP
ncbi:MAG: cyclic nucleotide-binding domain-containing protein [Caldilineaceae bacterium]